MNPTSFLFERSKLKVILIGLIAAITSGCQQEVDEKNTASQTGVVTNQTFQSIKNQDLKIMKTSDTHQQLKENLDEVSENSEPKVSFFFSEAYNGASTEQTNSFDCHQKIYAIVQLDNYKYGQHQIDIKWTDPLGKTRERTSTPLFINQATQYSWSAIKLHAAPGSNLIAWANPAAGMEEFMGQWTVELSIDKEKISKQNVEVIC